jgi:hypothetical protein
VSRWPPESNLIHVMGKEYSPFGDTKARRTFLVSRMLNTRSMRKLQRLSRRRTRNILTARNVLYPLAYLVQIGFHKKDPQKLLDLIVKINRTLEECTSREQATLRICTVLLPAGGTSQKDEL